MNNGTPMPTLENMLKEIVGFKYEAPTPPTQDQALGTVTPVTEFRKARTWKEIESEPVEKAQCPKCGGYRTATLADCIHCYVCDGAYPQIDLGGSTEGRARSSDSALLDNAAQPEAQAVDIARGSGNQAPPAQPPIIPKFLIHSTYDLWLGKEDYLGPCKINDVLTSPSSGQVAYGIHVLSEGSIHLYWEDDLTEEEEV